MGTYVAADKSNLRPCVEIIMKELNRVKKRRLSQKTLDIVKAQLKGQLTLGMESTYSRMNRLARHEIYTGGYLSLAATLRLIDRVTRDDIVALSRRIIDPALMTAVAMGPLPKSFFTDIDWSPLQ